MFGRQTSVIYETCKRFISSVLYLHILMRWWRYVSTTHEQCNCVGSWTYNHCLDSRLSNESRLIQFTSNEAYKLCWLRVQNNNWQKHYCFLEASAEWKTHEINVYCRFAFTSNNKWENYIIILFFWILVVVDVNVSASKD